MVDAADHLQVGVLGPFEARAGDRAIVIRGRTERALLARLALENNRPVGTDRMVSDLWGEQAPRRPRQAIHALVFRLRQALGESAAALRTSDCGYTLQLAADDLDLRRFEALAAAGRAARACGDLDGAARDLMAALALWRGEALAGLDDCPFVRSRGRRLEAARFEVLVERLGTDLDRGLLAGLIPELDALAVERPAHEGLHRLLIIALYRAGRQVDALAAHERLRKHLAGQFGLDLSPALKELAMEVLRQEPGLDWRAQAAGPDPPAATLPAPPPQHRIRGGLPHPMTSFVGRKAELAEVLRLVQRHRLVTIAGSGGCGKTRLAVAAGHQLAADGEVRFVRLEGLTDGDLIAGAVAEALGVRLGHANPAPTELADGLAERNVLILLDNCEHVLPACADLVVTVLESAPTVRFLLTSREQLSVPGEALLRLRPLAAPSPDEPEEIMAASDAVQLFTERATAAAGSAGQFGLAAMPAVAEVCRQLDGIPLAIEIAAVRLATLSLDQLSRRLADRFAVLRGESRAAVPRHRTLLAAMAWSYDLLDEQERVLFARLAVFASAFPLEAAEVVCAGGIVALADVCDLLPRLAAKSLVVVDQAAGAVEYLLLNTVREYADSCLLDPAERHELARRHHDWCLDQVTGAVAALRFGDQLWWARRMRSCMDDVRIALDWALGPQGQTVALAAELWPIWEMHGQEREGRQWISRALARTEAVGRPNGRVSSSARPS